MEEKSEAKNPIRTLLRGTVCIVYMIVIAGLVYLGVTLTRDLVLAIALVPALFISARTVDKALAMILGKELPQ